MKLGRPKGTNKSNVKAPESDKIHASAAVNAGDEDEDEGMVDLD